MYVRVPRFGSFERFQDRPDGVSAETEAALTAAGIAVNVSSLALVAHLAIKAPSMAGALLSAWCLCCIFTPSSLVSGIASIGVAASGNK